MGRKHTTRRPYRIYNYKVVSDRVAFVWSTSQHSPAFHKERSFWTSSSLDVPAGVTQEEGHTGFFIQLPSAVRALIFLARRIQPFLSLVDREVEFCVVVAVVVVVVCVSHIILTDPLRIQPWSQDRRNQTKSNRKSEISRQSRQKRTAKKVASKGHRRDKIENTNKKHTGNRNKLEATA